MRVRVRVCVRVRMRVRVRLPCLLNSSRYTAGVDLIIYSCLHTHTHAPSKNLRSIDL